MTPLDIYVLDAPILRQETTVLTEVTDAHRRLIDDMFETMHLARGIGLAATQVGRLERICVIDIDKVQYALVNPEIIASDGEQTGEEGCLSIPEIFGDVTRAKHVVVRALDRNGKHDSRSTPTICSRAACSTRSIICTDDCSSTTSVSSSDRQR